MKKLIAIILLVINLFNIGGQLILHQYFSYQSNKFFKEQISRGRYNVNDLTEIVLPNNMPGITDWKGYEDVSGRISFENSSYNYVKMKMTRHAIYLMCVPNYETTKLVSQNMIAVKHVKDFLVPQKHHIPFAKISLAQTFNYNFTSLTFTAPFKKLVQAVVQPCPQLLYHALDIPEQPPKGSC